MGDILKEAIADAKAVRETALENAKMALEEAFTPQIKSMLSAKLKEEELEEDEVPVTEEEDEDEAEEGRHEEGEHDEEGYTVAAQRGLLQENEHEEGHTVRSAIEAAGSEQDLGTSKIIQQHSGFRKVP